MVTDSCPAAQVNISTAAKADFMPNLPLLKRGLLNWVELFSLLRKEKRKLFSGVWTQTLVTKVECFMGLNTVGSHGNEVTINKRVKFAKSTLHDVSDPHTMLNRSALKKIQKEIFLFSVVCKLRMWVYICSMI